MDHRAEILETVRACGFDRVGCLPLAEAGDPGIAAWLAAGQHGEMRWLEDHAAAKAAPAERFPHYPSAVIAALEYGEVSAAPRDPFTGNISRYALGTDYHEVLKPRLAEAGRRLADRFPGLRTRAFVDTGPLNEKLIAARAGLGFIGQNTNLIDPRRGSYLFLGVLLVNVRLAATGPPEPDRCGVCIACRPACPTQAIVAPYVLDARRCISYLTIELRGVIPRELRPLIGNRIFGCDDCQECCPWNRFARRDPPEPFRPRSDLRTRSLSQWLALDEASWTRTFRGSAVQRAGYRGFLRNVLVALGNARSAGAVPALLPWLAHPDPLLRRHAVWAAGRTGAGSAAAALASRLTEEADPSVREEICDALSTTPDTGGR